MTEASVLTEDTSINTLYKDTLRIQYEGIGI